MSIELEQSVKDRLQTEINAEIAAHKIVFYGKGTKEMPMCGFTIETCQFFENLGYPFEVVNVLQDMDKRAVLAEMTLFNADICSAPNGAPAGKTTDWAITFIPPPDFVVNPSALSSAPFVATRAIARAARRPDR